MQQTSGTPQDQREAANKVRMLSLGTSAIMKLLEQRRANKGSDAAKFSAEADHSASVKDIGSAVVSNALAEVNMTPDTARKRRRLEELNESVAQIPPTTPIPIKNAIVSHSTSHVASNRASLNRS